MKTEPFEAMLTGGHPNSLGRTLEVVDIVLADRRKLDELYSCYFSKDEVVRLRTSNAMKRVSKQHPKWLVPYVDGLLTEIAEIDQASTQWTLALLFEMLAPHMTIRQRAAAEKVLKRNLTTMTDWIVLNNTMQTLGAWAETDPVLRDWLLPHLERLSQDSRKSVAKKARRLKAALT